LSLQTPTTAEIADLIVAQLQSSLNQTIPLLPKAFNRVLAKVLAGVFILIYKYAGFMFLQIFVETASVEETTVLGKTVSPLKSWGRLIGIGDPTAATSAEMLIDIVVTNQTGSLISGTQLVNNDNGVTYITVGDVLLNAPTIQATIQAVGDQSGGDGSGTIGNLDPGAIVSFANPLANVERDATVDSQVTTGADPEATSAYRQRVIDRFQKRPQGGAYADYQAWGTSVQGILNVYPYTSPTPGQVDVYSEATVESSGDPDGIPTQAQLDAVLDAINYDENGLATRRPASVYVNSYPIERLGFDVQVFGLDADNSAAVQSDIEIALTEFFTDREPFIVGLSPLPRNDRVNLSAISGVVDDIVSAAGGLFDRVECQNAGLEVITFTLGEGQKAKLSSLTFLS